MTSNPSSLATDLVAALAELDHLTSRLADLTAADAWAALPAPALPDLVASTAASADAVQSVLTVGAGALHRSGALAAHGFVSTTRWLENEVGMSHSDASTVIARASALASDYAATRGALLGSPRSDGFVRPCCAGAHDARQRTTGCRSRHDG